MKKRLYLLLTILVASSLLVSCFGLILKLRLGDSFQKYQEESVIALPFVLFKDGKVDDVLWKPRPSVPAETTEAPTTVPAATETTASNETSVPPTTAPVNETTVPETTVPETTLPPRKLPVYGEDESFFDDVLFIGDSRLCGLRDYARLGQADYFCDVGMTIFNLWDRTTSDKDFGSCDLATLLAQKHYNKIYIALGINECGYPTGSIESEYQSLIQRLQDAQPDAIVISQSIMTVGRDFAASADYFSISHLAELNEMFASFADGKKVFYLDVNEAVADSEGYLPEEMSSDGCHLYAVENAVWAKWLCDSAERLPR